jgi:hypothetical protein
MAKNGSVLVVDDEEIMRALDCLLYQPYEQTDDEIDTVKESTRRSS